MAIHAENNCILITKAEKTALLGGHFIYNSNWTTTETPHSANIVQTVEKNGVDVSSDPTQWEHNVNIGTNGISLRYNEAVMAQLIADENSNNAALKFYRPPGINGGTVTQGELAMELAGNLLNFYGSSTSIPDVSLTSTGLNITKGSIVLGGHGTSGINSGDIALSNVDFDRTINNISRSNLRLAIGNKFGVKNDGALYASNVDISGKIIATEGQIGGASITNGTLIVKNANIESLNGNKITENSITVDKITVNNLVGSNGWINLHEGKFFYGNGTSFATASNAIEWNGTKLQIKADEFLLSSGKTIQESIETVETWFYSVAPTTSNEPAVNWTSETLKEQHLRDIYFDTTSGKSYRWALTSESGVTPKTYGWVEIEDVQLSALQGRVATAETKIEQNSEAITLKANATDVYTKQAANALLEVKANKATLTSEINASADTVKISADKVNIQGVITAINNDTTTTINGGKITTGTLHASDIYVGADVLTNVLDNITDELGNVYQLNVLTSYTSTSVVHTAQLLQNGVDIASQTPNDFEWSAQLTNGFEYIGTGQSITIPQSSLNYAHAVTVAWTRRQYANLLTNTGNKLRISTGAYLLGRNEY